MKVGCKKSCPFTPYKCCALPYHIVLHPPHCIQIVNNMLTKSVASSSFILPIVEVYIGSEKVFVYLDNCSTHSFITDRFLKSGGLRVKDEVMCSSGSIHGSQILSTKIVDFTIRPPGSHVKYDITNAFVVSKLPAGRRAVACDVADSPHLQGLPLAAHSEDVEVSALIGQDHSHLLTPLEVRKHPDFPSVQVRSKPYAVKTLLGWAISGRGCVREPGKREVALLITHHESWKTRTAKERRKKMNKRISKRSLS